MNKNLVIKLIAVMAIIVSVMFIGEVKAASGSISVSSKSSTVVVGNSFTVNITLSSGSELGAWKFCIGYDTSKLRLTGSSLDSSQCMNAGVLSYNGQKSASYTMTFKALASGSATVYVNDYEVYGGDGSSMSISKGSKSFTLKTQAEIEASYSKNNNLKALSIEGVEISPAFNKDTLEYEATVDAGNEKINVIATKEDSAASVSGAGEIEVSEGANKVVVTVTAENGATKDYIINVTVKELNPIKVKIDGTNYTVVKKADNLKQPKTYEEKKITIDGEEVPAFYSKITKLTLVGLKDEAGNITLFSYDEKSKTYTLYKEITSKELIFMAMDYDKIPDGYKKSKITINGIEVVCFKPENGSKDFVLVYGMNVETGDEGFYVYDKVDKTLQRYNASLVDDLNKKATINLYVACGFGGALLVSIIILIVTINKKNKIVNKIKKYDFTKVKTKE